VIYISGILPKYLPKVWEDCEPYIEMGNNKSRDEMSTFDIYHKIEDGSMQLWVLSDDNTEIVSVLTTEIVEYPRKTTCRIVTLGGKDLDLWVADWLETLEAWALEKGCVAMETCCRKGFIKKLERFGYENTYTVLGKELTIKH
tara:strand:+ start:1134 stop:1562 length:429 start_codon:yes stop_codon:yes gene_type:complete